MHNFCDKREQSSLFELPSGAKIKNEVSNFCDKREQSSLFELPSGAKITTEVSNSQCIIIRLTAHDLRFIIFAINESMIFGS